MDSEPNLSVGRAPVFIPGDNTPVDLLLKITHEDNETLNCSRKTHHAGWLLQSCLWKHQVAESAHSRHDTFGDVDTGISTEHL